MKLTELLSHPTPSISFEVFPPKSESSYDTVKLATEEIAKLGPAFMSVTYGAGGGTSKYTLDIARAIKDNYGVPSIAHLTCVSSTKETVRERISDIKAAGIKNVMALRGDIPKDMEDADRSTWDFRHASDLITELRASGDFSIGGACYPEIHPESRDRKEDIFYLKKKVEAGCDFLTTQMFFDNSILYSFLYRIREAGITVPVVPGIMPITAREQLERAISISGSHIPERFKNLVDRFGHDRAAMLEAGVAYATDQIIDLYSNGINHVHVYSMNKPEVARKIMNNLSAILSK